MKIEGMMCHHCETFTRNALEAIDGVTVLEISHEKGTAVVSLSKPVSHEALTKAVTEEGYDVTDIR